MNDLFLNYDSIAAEYNQRYPAQRPTRRGLALLDLVKQVKAKNVLEVGSGTGFWLNLLYQACSGLYGLDYSAGMIEQARKRPAPLKARALLTRFDERSQHYEVKEKIKRGGKLNSYSSLL